MCYYKHTKNKTATGKLKMFIKKPKKTRVHILLPKHLLDELGKQAESQDISRSEYINAILRAHVYKNIDDGK